MIAAPSSTFLRNRRWSFAAIRALHDGTTAPPPPPQPPHRHPDTVAAAWQAARLDPAPDGLLRRGITVETLEHYRPLIRTDQRGHVPVRPSRRHHAV